MMKQMKPSSTSNYRFTHNTVENRPTTTTTTTTTTTSSGGCFRSILRRIFCITSLTSSSSNHHHQHHVKEEEEDPLLLPESDASSAAPGIVARLMGLESLPDNSMRRRRRRSKRRKNLIQTPYTEIQDDNFFILSFDHSIKTNSQKCNNKIIQENKEITASNLRIGDDLDNSSPNSVLDFLPDSETASSGDNSISSSKPTRTISEELEIYRKKTDRERLIKNGCNEIGKKQRSRNQNCAVKWDKRIGILAARETVKSSWVGDINIFKSSHTHFKNISRDLASEIFDQLLDELLINSF